MSDTPYNLKIEEKDNSTIEISGEIPASDFESYRKSALEFLKRDVEIPGFRKGNVPEKVLLQHVGEEKILSEMADKALRDAYGKILVSQKINAIGHPHVAVTKMAANNPLGFKISTAVVPEINLPDYNKLAAEVFSKKEKDVEVNDKELEEALLRIRTSLKDKEAGSEKDGDEEKEPPALTDEDVKKFGDYKNVADFKEKLKESIVKDKERKETERRRMKVAEKIIEKTTLDVPKILIDAELEKMLSQFRFDIERMGMKAEDYMKQLGKTEEEMKKEWETDAVKRVKLELIWDEISNKEDLKPDEEEVKKETEHLLSHHKDAKKENVEAYVSHVLMHQKVFEFLEKQGK